MCSDRADLVSHSWMLCYHVLWFWALSNNNHIKLSVNQSLRLYEIQLNMNNSIMYFSHISTFTLSNPSNNSLRSIYWYGEFHTGFTCVSKICETYENIFIVVNLWLIFIKLLLAVSQSSHIIHIIMIWHLSNYQITNVFHVVAAVLSLHWQICIVLDDLDLKYRETFCPLNFNCAWKIIYEQTNRMWMNLNVSSLWCVLSSQSRHSPIRYRE